MRGDLIRILNKLLKRKKRFDAIMIETTGLADPAPVAQVCTRAAAAGARRAVGASARITCCPRCPQTFFVDEDLKASLRLDSILTVVRAWGGGARAACPPRCARARPPSGAPLDSQVDAKHILLHLDEEKPDDVINESVQQVAFADKVLLNKVDLVSAEQKQEVLRRIRVRGAQGLHARRLGAAPCESDAHAAPIMPRCARRPSTAPWRSSSARTLRWTLLASWGCSRLIWRKFSAWTQPSSRCVQRAGPARVQAPSPPTAWPDARPYWSQVEDDDHHHHHDHSHEDCAECEGGDHHHHHHHHDHAHDEDCAQCTAGEAHGHSHGHKHDSRVTSVGIECEGGVAALPGPQAHARTHAFSAWLPALLACVRTPTQARWTWRSSTRG